MMKVVGFDLDDTLVPEVLFLKSGAHHIAKSLHEKHSCLPEARIRNAMLAAIENRRNQYSALECILEEFGLTGRVDMRSTVAEFRNHRPDPSIYHLSPSMHELLRELRLRPGIKMILITDGRSLTQRNKMRAACLFDYFEDADIYISEEIGYDKTSPATFLRVMEKYAGASEYHYVGDNPPKDFLHPSRLGWITHQARPFPLMIHPHGMPR